MENYNKFKGQTDGVVLYVIKNKKVNTDELKQIIDETFFEIKVGTLYSVLTRLKNKKAIDEFRISSKDGFRRKVYTLTKLGEKLFLKDYSQLFEDVVFPEKYEHKPELEKEDDVQENKEEQPSPILEKVQESTVKTDDNYQEYIKDGLNEDFDSFINLDSIFEEKSTSYNEELDDKIVISNENVENKIQENYEDNSINIDYSYDLPVENSNFDEFSYDADSKINSKYEYRSVLNKLFPKSAEKTVEFEEAVIEEVNSGKDDTSPSNSNYKSVESWNDAYEFSEKLGVKIRTSSDTNRYQGSKILVNRLRVFSTLTILLLALIEYVVLTAIITGLNFNLTQFIVVFAVYSIPFILSVFALLFAPKHKVKDLTKFVNSIEIALILTISTIIICFAISAIKPINFSNIVEIFDYLIYPSIFVINLPIYVILSHSLKKVDFFLTV